MAVLIDTTVTGNLTTNYGIRRTDADMSNWFQIFHCGDAPDANPPYSASFLHTRTPIPATLAGGLIANTPVTIEVAGYHTYSGEYTHNFKIIARVDSSDNFSYVIRGNVGTDNPATNIRVYRSDSVHGPAKRISFAMLKVGCCCNGWFWVRFRGYSSYAQSYPFATTGGASLNTNYY
jgi:hypothetical protein